MAAEFRLLGEIEAYVDGGRLDLGHARQRCVLGSLLVDVNRPVSVDQLIDRVWADDPPHRARNALAGYLSRLRTLLADGDVTIVSGPAGYTLTAEALSVDIHLFRHLAGQARASKDDAEANTLFQQALSLWRGEPFAALDTPWINEVRGAVEAERLSVQLDRNDTALRAGRHADIISDLAAAHQIHPLDERIAAQLMLAQYRCGRQSEALETYRQMRDRLVDELGIDPSPPLREVHQQILESDGATAGIQVVPTPAPSPPPPNRGPATNLPRLTKRFIGREREVVLVGEALERGLQVTLTGVGGVGKTRLALELASRSKDRFTDGAWFCELAPVADGAALPHAVASALRLQQKNAQGLGETLIDYLRPLELLLIIDNCEHVLDAAAELTDRIVRECPKVSVLVTSREPLGIEGEQVSPVSALADADATELFAERARASRPDFDPALEPVGAVAEICRRLDGIPLAIELAAARMRAMSSLDVARRLDRLRLLSGGARGAHPRQQSVTATIDWSYRLLAENEQSFFDRLSVFAGGFDLEAAHGVCAEDGSSEDDTLDLLTGLVDKSMVIVRGGTSRTRYGILETLRTYGRDRLRNRGLHDVLAARHAGYYTALLEQANAGMRGSEEQAWVERLMPGAGKNYTAPDYDNIRTAFEYAFASDIDLALRLVLPLPELMNRIGYHSAVWADRAVELAAPHHPLYTAVVGVAARAAWVNGQFPHARSLALLAAGRVPPPGTPYLAYPNDVLADLDLYEGNAAAALAFYEAQLAGVGDGTAPIRHVLIVDKLASCHQVSGTPDAALRAAEEAVAIADATANPTTRSLARCALGRALAPSDPDRALRLLDEAFELGALVENNWIIGTAWTESAVIRAAHGDPAVTARQFIELVDLWEKGGPGVIPQQWDTLRYVSRFLLRVGANDEALRLHCSIVAADMDPPLSAAQVAELGGALDGPRTGAEAVEFARTTLRRYC
jgi:predicted ATPase/DNA-binding SARP family transcriptional activator